MSFEELKEEFIKIKKEELDYIKKILEIRSKRLLSEYERLEIYRTIIKYQNKLDELVKEIFLEFRNDKKSKLYQKDNSEVIIEIDLDKKIIGLLSNYSDYSKEKTLKSLGINQENYKYEFTIHNIYYKYHELINLENIHLILGNQPFMDKHFYCYTGSISVDNAYDTDNVYNEVGYYAQYKNLFYNIKLIYGETQESLEKKKIEFEKDSAILNKKKYVNSYEVIKVFREELLNSENKSVNECVNKTKRRIIKLNYIRSPEYKEKELLNKINRLYKQVKGTMIKEEILYSGKFLKLFKETYELPNKKIVEKEKIERNKGKKAVIVVAITEDKFIITFQNRIKDKILAEFPSGYIEDNETILEAANRELKEETGYISDNLFILDKAYPTPGLDDNSYIYIVLANNCKKVEEVKEIGTELVKYGLFTIEELEYLINNNIMNGAMNKLAYYNLMSRICNKRDLYKPKEDIEFIKQNNKIKFMHYK